jgi:hypothetical protein
MRQTPMFHPDAPRKLKRLWREYPAYYRIAQYLNVNSATVWFALRKGREPTNEDIREKFGLPRRPRKPREKKDHDPTPIPQYLKWWRGLDATIKNIYIHEIYDQWSAASNSR